MKTLKKIFIWLGALVVAAVIGTILKHLFGISFRDVGPYTKIVYYTISILAALVIFITAIWATKKVA